MIGFGSSADGGFDRAGRDADERQEGHISFKDNRRIDPHTGEARVVPESAKSGGNNAGANNVDGNPVDASDVTAVPAAGSSDELSAAQAEAQERTADLQRLTAEYANYRKRVERDKVAARAAGKAAVFSELLAVCDDLDRAAEHGDLTGGFKNVADKLTGALRGLGLERYCAEGDEFDPNVHEAVQFSTSADVEHPTVTTVLRYGYTFAERVLRPAVVVVTGPADESGESDDQLAADTVADDTVADGTVADSPPGEETVPEEEAALDDGPGPDEEAAPDDWPAQH